MLLTAVGTALGLGGALVATRWLRNMLFGVDATDPLTFIALILLFSAVTIAACLAPVRRALRVDPIVTLRSE